jgi:hypothetical protein
VIGDAGMMFAALLRGEPRVRTGLPRHFLSQPGKGAGQFSDMPGQDQGHSRQVQQNRSV